MTTNRPPDPPWLWPVLRIKADLWINSKTISILLREPVLTKLRQRLGLGGCRLSGKPDLRSRASFWELARLD